MGFLGGMVAYFCKLQWVFPLLAVAALSSCITTPSGEKKFDPLEAAKRADESIDVFMERQTFQAKKPGMWDDQKPKTTPPPPAEGTQVGNPG